MQYPTFMRAAVASVAIVSASGAATAAPLPVNLHHAKPEFTYIDAVIGRNEDNDANTVQLEASYAPYKDLFFKLGLSHQLSNSGARKNSSIVAGVGMNYDTTTLSKPTSLYGVVSLGLSNASDDGSFNEVEAALEVGARVLVAPRLELNASIQGTNAPGLSDETISFVLGVVYRLTDHWDIGVELEDAENVMLKARYHFDHWLGH